MGGVRGWSFPLPLYYGTFSSGHLYQVLFEGRVLWQEEKEVGEKKEGLEERVGLGGSGAH